MKIGPEVHVTANGFEHGAAECGCDRVARCCLECPLSECVYERAPMAPSPKPGARASAHVRQARLRQRHADIRSRARDGEYVEDLMAEYGLSRRSLVRLLTGIPRRYRSTEARQRRAEARRQAVRAALRRERERKRPALVAILARVVAQHGFEVDVIVGHNDRRPMTHMEHLARYRAIEAMTEHGATALEIGDLLGMTDETIRTLRHQGRRRFGTSAPSAGLDSGHEQDVGRPAQSRSGAHSSPALVAGDSDHRAPPRPRYSGDGARIPPSGPAPSLTARADERARGLRADRSREPVSAHYGGDS